MKDFYIEPTKFQEQIDKFSSGGEAIKELKYSLDENGVRLQSVDRFLECVEAFNETIGLFAQMSAQDAESMRQIKARWMNKDTADARKTLLQILFGK